MEDLGFDSWQGKGLFFFLYSKMSTPALKQTQPRILWKSGVKQVGCDVDRSPPCIAPLLPVVGRTTVSLL